MSDMDTDKKINKHLERFMSLKQTVVCGGADGVMQDVSNMPVRWRQ